MKSGQYAMSQVSDQARPQRSARARAPQAQAAGTSTSNERDTKAALWDLFASAFCIDVPPERYTLFKSLHSAFDVQYRKPCWFALKPNGALVYNAPLVHTVTHTSPLRLINVSSWIFRHHFMDMLNIEYGLSSMQAKMRFMLPLGLPTPKAHEEFVKGELPDAYASRPAEEAARTKYTLLSDAVYGQRLSDFHLDSQMAFKMAELYGKHFDGFVMLHDQATTWAPPTHVFASEVCLFRPDQCGLMVKSSVRNSMWRAQPGSSRSGGGQRRRRTKSSAAGGAPPMTEREAALHEIKTNWIHAKFTDLAERWGITVEEVEREREREKAGRALSLFDEFDQYIQEYYRCLEAGEPVPTSDEFQARAGSASHRHDPVPASRTGGSSHRHGAKKKAARP